MTRLAATLLGPALMAVASAALGRLFLRALALRLRQGEERALEFIAGAGLLSLVVAAAGAMHLARKGVFVTVSLAAAGLALWRTRGRAEKTLPRLPRAWKLGFALLLAVYGGLYLLRAAAPELAGGERLGLAFREWDARRLLAPPEPVRMLFLMVFSVGKHSAAAVAHVLFLLALPLAMLGYARRCGFPEAGVVAGLMVFLCPAAAVAGTSALDDAAVAAFLFAAFYFLEVREAGGGAGALAAAAAMAGFALWVRHPVPPAPAFRGIREMALLGTPAGSLLGPLFLLAPFALLALRYREGRRLLLAALVVGAPGLAGGEARWLIPALPFIALATALAFRHTPGALPALAVAQAVFCWPPVTGMHANLDAWRILHVKLAPALGQVPEEEYLNERLSGFLPARLADECVPRGEKVFAIGDVARAYTLHEIVSGGVLRDAVLTPLRPAWQPSRRLRFSFAERRLSGLRLRGTAELAEFRVLSGGREVPRDMRWRLRADPDANAARRAFDNSYVTRWRGTALELEFPAGVQAGGVLLECPPGQEAGGLSLEGRPEGGGWVPLAAGPAVEDGAPPLHLREAAMEELQARGIRYLLVSNGDEGAADFRARNRLWRILPVMELWDATVYRLE